MARPTDEERTRGCLAFQPFVTAWNLPLNPENVELIVYAVLEASRSEQTLDEIDAGSKLLIAEDREAHERMIAKMHESIQSRPFVIVRQDDFGTRFNVARFASRAEAEKRLADLESGYPHHQSYWLEEDPPR